ncbi:MAG: bifunctional diaminohydroxyphosphoribosylaminopyrimidine deaminase/5-amino-6-(5-phosphoribosylamino)uracil reductase RibD [Sneathiella sp.]
MASQAEDQTLDIHYMTIALRLARRGWGHVAPNPAVGCVLVREDKIVGRGWTQDGGRPHAETMALQQAGALAEGATAYVTLEPCSHHGKTAPCSEALIAAGIQRVVSALQDPDERVNGRGIKLLEDAGIQVTTRVCEAEALENNLGFVLAKTINRPLVSLKMATTLDGKIATRTGNSKWITGTEARQYGHMLRSQHDAILVGIGTALADDPMLNCRVPGLEKYAPGRIVADSRLRLPLTSNLVKTARDIPLWIITAPENNPDRIKAFEELGVRILECEPDASGYPTMKRALEQLVELGITRLLVEGGSHLQASLVKEGLADQLYWFRAAKIIGGDGISVLQSIGLTEVHKAPALKLVETRRLGEDQMENYLLRNE